MSQAFLFCILRPQNNHFIVLFKFFLNLFLPHFAWDIVISITIGLSSHVVHPIVSHWSNQVFTPRG